MTKEMENKSKSMTGRVRGYEVAKGFEGKEVVLPEMGTVDSAGSDFRAIENVALEPWKTTLVHTGVKAYMQKGEVLKIYDRSSLATKRDLVISNHVGVIDRSYYGNPKNDGEIIIALYNRSNSMKYIEKGERIAQGVFESYLEPDTGVSDKERVGGFGSTGSK